VSHRLRKEDVLNQGLVDDGAGTLEERGQSAVRKVATTPKVVSSRVSVFSDKLAEDNVHVRNVIVVARSRDERRAGGKEGDVEGPQVLKGGANRKEGVQANESLIGVRPTVKGSNNFTYHAFDSLIMLARDDKE